MKVTAPEKRIRIEKPVIIQQEMPPPPSVHPTPESLDSLVASPAPLAPPSVSSASLITTIQGEVEQKLEKQKEDNRDVMETVTVWLDY